MANAHRFEMKLVWPQAPFLSSFLMLLNSLEVDENKNADTEECNCFKAAYNFHDLVDFRAAQH
jgi:hypothetical protein